MHGLKDVEMECAVALLRYTDLLPVDKAFFDAGAACKAAGAQSMAFVFFNRFVDLGDLIADPESGDIDNSDFMLTDIPSPFDIHLPPSHNFTEDAREEVRNWVLEQAMDNEVGASLTLSSCDKCKTQLFEGAVKCPSQSCAHEHDVCLVSGYPVRTGRSVECKSCGRKARVSAVCACCRFASLLSVFFVSLSSASSVAACVSIVHPSLPFPSLSLPSFLLSPSATSGTSSSSRPRRARAAARCRGRRTRPSYYWPSY
jgi:hypothetical protein